MGALNPQNPKTPETAVAEAGSHPPASISCVHMSTMSTLLPYGELPIILGEMPMKPPEPMEPDGGHSGPAQAAKLGVIPVPVLLIFICMNACITRRADGGGGGAGGRAAG